MRESVGIFLSFHFLCIQVRFRANPVSLLLFTSFHRSFFASKEKKRRAAEGQNAGDGAGENTEERVITLRALNLEDFKQAKNQVIQYTSYLLISSQIHQSLCSLSPYFSITFRVTPTSPRLPSFKHKFKQKTIKRKQTNDTNLIARVSQKTLSEFTKRRH